MSKRLIDLTVSSLALLLLSPLFIILAVAVRLSSPGPIFFRQWRLGKGAAPFRILKFRSMFVDAPDLRNPDGSTYSTGNDPRVTRVGRFLRTTSLDELPQLFNILKGEMSLVGPRPDQVDQLRYYTDIERRKLSVKPGLTGLAQINGRNRIPWEQRKALDLEYVDSQSLGLDLRILLATCWYILQRREVDQESVFVDPGVAPSNHQPGVK